MHEIGAMIWFKGHEYKIVTKPYALHGHIWQDAEGHGKIITVPTPDQQAAYVAQQQTDYAEIQEGFRRLKNQR